jgi:hypothetical protein
VRGPREPSVPVVKKITEVRLRSCVTVSTALTAVTGCCLDGLLSGVCVCQNQLAMLGFPDQAFIVVPPGRTATCIHVWMGAEFIEDFGYAKGPEMAGEFLAPQSMPPQVCF